MPILEVKVSHKPSPEIAKKISDTLIDLTSKVLKKKPNLTSIAIDFVDPEHWFISGKSLKELGKSSFHLNIKVVDSTNTKDEKAQYIAETFAAFSKLLGDLHPESYVYIQDCQADAYGFGGQTQEWRYINKGQ